MDQLPSMDNTFGAIFIGVVVAAVLYGVSCAQVFYYFQHYSGKDSRGTKAVVVATLICDTIHQALISHTAYTYVVTYYARPEMSGSLVWSLIVQVIPSAITAFLVQSFYALRIWKFSGKNVMIAATLSIIIVGQFIANIVYVTMAVKKDSFTELVKFKSLSVSITTLAAAGDILITIILSALLHSARGNLRRSNTMINMLIAFTVQTGMLTSICVSVAIVILLALPNTLIYAALYFLLCRLYCNSLLAMLNVRDSIRERGLGISLRLTNNPGSSDNRKEIDIRASITGAGTHAYAAGVKAHDSDDSSPPFVHSKSHTDISEVIEDLESRRESS